MTEQIFKKDLTLDFSNQNKIKRIYHISDIHINLRARHDEYSEVFKNLNDFLISEKKKYNIPINQNKDIECVVVITGDILHSKTELLPECIELTRKFITQLSELMPVILMAGNHDLNINNNERLDGLTPIINGINKKYPVYYLKKTGIYKFYNIIWSLSSVQNYQIINPNSFDKHDFEQRNEYDKIYKICLFHGRVNGAILFNNSKLEGETNKKNNKTITPSSFEGYDYTLLGDIHKFQYLNTTSIKKKMAYVGSLIQQNHGESLNNHGVLIWDIENNTSLFQNIKNNFGFISYTIKNNYEIDTIEKDINNLVKKYPHNLRLRLLYEQINNNQLQEIISIFKQYFNVLEVVFNDISQNQDQIEKELTLNISDINFQNKLIETYLIQSSDIDKKTIELIKKINVSFNENLKENTFHLNTKWSLNKLEFSNLFSYAENNVINFKKYKGILGIIAPNHMGKSSIIDIILFTLFDKFPRKGNIKDIINNRKKTFKSKISLIIGKWKYVIEKNGVKNAKNRVSCKLNFYRINKENIKQSLNEDTQAKTKEAILKYIGCYEDIIQTSVSLQNNNCNFIEAENTARKKELERILQVNFIEQLLKKVSTEISGKRAVYKHIQNNCYVESIIKLQTNIKETTIKINNFHNYEQKLKEELIKLEEVKDKLREQIIPDLDEKLNQFSISIESDKNPLNYIEELNTKIQDYQKQLDDIKIKKEFENISLDNLSKIKDEKESKYNEDKEKYQKQLLELNNQIDENYSKIKSLKYSYSQKDEKEIGSVLINKLIDEYKSKYNSDEIKLKKCLNDKNKLDKFNEKINTNNKEIIKLTQTLNEINLNQLPEPLIEILEQTNIVELNDDHEQYINTLNMSIDSSINNKKKLTTEQKKQLKNFNIEQFIENCKSLFNYQYIEDYQTLNEKITLKEIELKNNIKSLEKDNKSIEKKIDKLKKLKLDVVKDIIVLKMKEFKMNINNLNLDLEIIKKNKTIYTTLKDLKIKQLDVQKKIDYNKDWEEFNIEYQNILKKNQIKTQSDNLKNKCDYVQNNLKTLLELEQNKIKNNEFETQLQDTLSKIDKIQESLKSNDSELNMAKASFISNNTKLTEHKKEVKKMEDIEKELNLYLIYQNCLKNLPFIIIKKIVPKIESKINNLLCVCTNFMIKIIIENNKIDIYIDRPVYNGQLILLNNASGFERFISSLAIRIALIEISQLPKPTFIAIDEGWSSFDYHNINNARVIFDFLNSKFNLVLSISHLPQIKEHCNEQINLKKDENGFSKII